MTALELRRARLEDADSIRDLVRQAYAKWVPVIGREPKPMSANYDLAVRAHWVWVLTDLEGIVAVLEIIPQPDHLLIENIAVAPSHQGRGLASQLMAYAETIAHEQGLSELRLYTNQSFAENLALYTRLGYVETHREDFSHLGGAQTIVVYMSKWLEVIQ